jgi:hypothetical protein
MDRLEPEVFGSLLAPFCEDEEVYSLATTEAGFAQFLLKDSTWQPRLWIKYEAVVRPFHAGHGDILHSKALHEALNAVAKDLPPLLRRPKDALIRWEVHESQMWNKTVQMWIHLRRSEVAARHLGSPEAEHIDGNVQVVEADLQALQVLAQAPNRREAEGPEPAVCSALDRMWRKRWEQKTQLRQQLLETPSVLQSRIS